MIGLLAKKLGMTQLFNEHGRAVAVTVLEAGPCTVTQVKEPKDGGARAIQVGFESIEGKRLNKPMQGHFKKANTGAFRYLTEFRGAPQESYAVGQELRVGLFQEGELVDVTGTSIGKGFQGGVKRWHWKGGPATHGSMSHRAPGSIGSTTFPGRVVRGHHLPGHMGNRRVTVQNLRIMKIDAEANLLVIEGAVPGPEQRLMMVKKSVKRPGVVVAAKGMAQVVEEEEDEKAKKPAAKKK
ncbi:MAG: 50S ribosomal protein L3 [Candidatus Omnitrophica bacterium]|nr:50S ribosomal protein L3 [Candidatus Omnitrophota bacterium]